jgi:hypothetical protein
MGGGSRGTVRDLVTGCLALASRWPAVASASTGGSAGRWCLSASMHEMTPGGDRGYDGHRCIVKNAMRGRLSKGHLVGNDRRCRSKGRGWVWTVTGTVSGRLRNGRRP